uniref:Uncharacterized protein n=2 Tax=Eutreptiella gymnastica TaxID=73025 RepID=A0A7S4D299_9EUGL
MLVVAIGYRCSTCLLADMTAVAHPAISSRQYTCWLQLAAHEVYDVKYFKGEDGDKVVLAVTVVTPPVEESGEVRIYGLVWLMWDNENQRPVAAKVGYMNETSIEDEKNVYDQMVEKLGAKKKYLLKVRGYNRIFKAHRGVKTDDHHDWIITSVKGVTFRDVLGQPEAESLPHALSAAKCVPSPSSAELLPSRQSG